MLTLYEECRVFIVAGAVILNAILVLYFWRRSKSENRYMDYYKGFLLLLLAYLLPQVFRIFGVAPRSINYIYVIKAIWVLVFCTAGMILIVRGYRRGNKKGSSVAVQQSS